MLEGRDQGGGVEGEEEVLWVGEGHGGPRSAGSYLKLMPLGYIFKKEK